MEETKLSTLDLVEMELKGIYEGGFPPREIIELDDEEVLKAIQEFEDMQRTD